jgi:mRNA-degrading endonuclease RelE of RelBE toxin-antitoxin system
LTGFEPPLYRLRSGAFRAYYRIISGEVIILAITHKKESDKVLKKYQ